MEPPAYHPEPPFPLRSHPPNSHNHPGFGSPWCSFHNPLKILTHPREGEREGASPRRRKAPRPKWVICAQSYRSPQIPNRAVLEPEVLQLCVLGWRWVGFRVLGRVVGTARPVANKKSLQHGCQKQRGGPYCLSSSHVSSSIPQRDQTPRSL